MGQSYNGQPCTRGMIICTFKTFGLPVDKLLTWLNDFATLKGVARVGLVEYANEDFSNAKYLVGASDERVPLDAKAAKDIAKVKCDENHTYAYMVQTDTAVMSGAWTPEAAVTIMSKLQDNGTLQIVDQSYNVVDVKTSSKTHHGFNTKSGSVSIILEEAEGLMSSTSMLGETVITQDIFVSDFLTDTHDYRNALVIRQSYAVNVQEKSSQCVVTLPSGNKIVSTTEIEGEEVPVGWFVKEPGGTEWIALADTEDQLKAAEGIKSDYDVIHRVRVGNVQEGICKVQVLTSGTESGHVYKLVYDPVSESYSIWDCPE